MKTVDSMQRIRKALKDENYIADDELAFSLYLAQQMEKPLLLEGEPGVGKTEIAKVVAAVLDRKLNWFTRWDRFDPDKKNWVTPGDDNYNLVHTGLAWEFYHHWMLLLVYERIMYEENNAGLGKVPVLAKDKDDDWRVQTALQIKF